MIKVNRYTEINGLGPLPDANDYVYVYYICDNCIGVWAIDSEALLIEEPYILQPMCPDCDIALRKLE